MSYVDAGYAIALVALALYAVSLVVRRRRLERAAARGTRAGAVAGGRDTVRVDDGPGSTGHPHR